MKRIIIVILYSVLLSCNIFSQIVDSIAFINYDLKYVGIHKFFLKCDSSYIPGFNGQDTIEYLLPNDRITIINEYKNGYKIKTTGFWKNGNKYRETFYNGKKTNGSDTRWYKNGVKEFQVLYYNGNPTTPTIRWYEDGNIKGIDYNCDCSEYLKEFYPNGLIKMDVRRPFDTLPSVLWQRDYYENGQIFKETIYNYKRQKYNMFYMNGQKSHEGFIYNLELGLLGKWEEWHENGVKKREYYFNDSIPNQCEGIWLWWNEKGKLTRKEVYENGKLIEQHFYTKQKNEEIFFENAN